MLHSTLVIRHANRTVGRWVLIDVVLSDAKIVVMTCACSQCRVSHIVSTTGSSELHDNKHLSNFEDDSGKIIMKEINRPKISNLLHECLSLVDENDKQRQSALSIGRNWFTKYFSFRLLLTITGIRVVNMHR